MKPSSFAKITGRAYGRRFAVEVPESLADEARSRLPFGWVPDDGPPERRWEAREWGDARWVAANSDVVLAETPTGQEALDWMIGDLELWVAEHAEGMVFVHAGAVAWGGRAILVPGRTLAGKSTLVAALVRAGATYYSDEYAVIGPDGLVRPYARMLSIRPASGGAGLRTPVSDLGGTAGTEPVPLALVAQLRYDAASGWAVEELSAGRNALALIENTIPAQTRPVEVMDHLQAATEGVRGLSGTRGEADEAAERLLSVLDDARAAPEC